MSVTFNLITHISLLQDWHPNH